MILILRIGGDAVDVERVSGLTTLVPYRVEHRGIGRAKANCLFYDIATPHAASERQGFTDLKKFVREHENFLTSTENDPGVTIRAIDIGIVIESNLAGKTITLDAELVRSLGEMGLSVTLSIYKESESKVEVSE